MINLSDKQSQKSISFFIYKLKFKHTTALPNIKLLIKTLRVFVNSEFSEVHLVKNQSRKVCQKKLRKYVS